MVLISILGDFHSSILPIFNNFKDDISKHLLIYDDFKRDKRKAKEVQKGLKTFKKKFNHNYKLDSYMLDEDSLEALEKCVEEIKQLSSKYSDIYINTTDGFSTITTILNHKLFKHGVNFISYDMFDNEYNILNNYGLTKHKIINNLNIEEHFLLKGYSLEKKEFKNFAQTHENTIKELFEKEHEAFEEYLKIPRNKYKTVKKLPDGTIKNMLLKLNQENTPSHDSFITGGLYELYIFNLIKGLDYDDIEVGLIVKRECCKSSIKNEFDILLMKDNHLHMIECKYRDYSKKNKPDELVYKYIALSEVIDEDGKMIMVVKNKLFKDLRKSYEENLTGFEKRAKLNNIFFKGAVHKNPTLFSMHVKNIFELGGN